MTWFDIECSTIGREVYQLEGKDKEEALKKLYTEGPLPVVSEVLTFEVVDVRERKD